VFNNIDSREVNTSLLSSFIFALYPGMKGFMNPRIFLVILILKKGDVIA
jgi:hypothetical protein